MGSVGDCFDNAMAESFFATLECELLDRSTFRTRAEAERAIFEFIEGWYNPHRRHSALGYLSPISFERQHAQHRAGFWPQMWNCPLKRGNSREKLDFQFVLGAAAYNLVRMRNLGVAAC